MSDLERFKKAQKSSYDTALKEIKNGRKKSHWMWYIFPQIQGLGYSPTARYYAIQNIDEAREYLADPVLGPRLTEICEAALAAASSDPGEVFGYPDDLKLCSSMTLFEAANPENKIFGKVLDKYFSGKRDENTLEILIGQ